MGVGVVVVPSLGHSRITWSTPGYSPARAFVKAPEGLGECWGSTRVFWLAVGAPLSVISRLLQAPPPLRSRGSNCLVWELAWPAYQGKGLFWQRGVGSCVWTRLDCAGCREWVGFRASRFPWNEVCEVCRLGYNSGERRFFAVTSFQRTQERLRTVHVPQIWISTSVRLVNDW